MSELAAAIRKARGLKTKVAFAADLKVTHQTVLSWERGKHVPAYEQAVALENLGVPRELLMAGHGPREASEVAA